VLRSGSAGAWAVKLLVDAREREVYATIRNEGVPCEERVLPQVHTWHISYSVVYTAWRGVAWQRTSNYLGATCSTQQRHGGRPQGDYLWVATSSSGGVVTEAVLDYIVERKRLDDLRASIIDGRYGMITDRRQQCRVSECIRSVGSAPL
jgi:hypothetical protein